MTTGKGYLALVQQAKTTEEKIGILKRLVEKDAGIFSSFGKENQRRIIEALAEDPKILVFQAHNLVKLAVVSHQPDLVKRLITRIMQAAKQGEDDTPYDRRGSIGLGLRDGLWLLIPHATTKRTLSHLADVYVEDYGDITARPFIRYTLASGYTDITKFAVVDGVLKALHKRSVNEKDDQNTFLTLYHIATGIFDAFDEPRTYRYDNRVRYISDGSRQKYARRLVPYVIPLMHLLYSGHPDRPRDMGDFVPAYIWGISGIVGYYSHLAHLEEGFSRFLRYYNPYKAGVKDYLFNPRIAKRFYSDYEYPFRRDVDTDLYERMLPPSYWGIFREKEFSPHTYRGLYLNERVEVLTEGRSYAFLFGGGEVVRENVVETDLGKGITGTLHYAVRRNTFYDAKTDTVLGVFYPVVSDEEMPFDIEFIQSDSRFCSLREVALNLYPEDRKKLRIRLTYFRDKHYKGDRKSDVSVFSTYLPEEYEVEEILRKKVKVGRIIGGDKDDTLKLLKSFVSDFVLPNRSLIERVAKGEKVSRERGRQ